MTPAEQLEALMEAARDPAHKRVSAMVRVRNEADFLEPAVRSIVDLVDEVVLVDNLSTDATPAIIERLAEAYPHKVATHTYPHRIRRVGHENWTTSERVSNRPPPELSSTYYNWCLRLCTMPYVLKWDGDMIATRAFGQALERWRTSDRAVLAFRGMNVHPDREHLIAARCTDREALLARLSVPGLPKWVTVLTYDALEPRLFPVRFARFDDRIRWTQSLSSPCNAPEARGRARLTVEEPCFLHMKFCKPDPLANYSPDLREVIRSNIDRGPALDAEALALLGTWGLAAPALAAPSTRAGESA